MRLPYLGDRPNNPTTTCFQVRIWIADDELAARVGANYNTRGEKVNESTAKYKAPEGPEQRIAQNLVRRSPHLGIDNVEIHAMSVSARSAKLTAFSTISKAIEKTWGAGPVGAADIEAQSSWLVSAWDSLVSVRPEFGRLSTPARIETRSTSIAGSSVTIHALIAAMSTMYLDSLDPSKEFPKLAQHLRSHRSLLVWLWGVGAGGWCGWWWGVPVGWACGSWEGCVVGQVAKKAGVVAWTGAWRLPAGKRDHQAAVRAQRRRDRACGGPAAA